MKKLCITCKSTKNISESTYKVRKSKLEKKRIFPNDSPPNLKNIKEKRPTNYDMTFNLNLNKNDSSKIILYFASYLKQSCDKIPSADKSYGSYKNLGITKVDKNGNAKLYLKCPNIYVDEGEVYYPHVHYILTNKEKTKWINKLYMKLVICPVNKKQVQQAIKNKCVMIINALPMDEYIKERIPNSISLPYNTSVSNDSIVSYIKIMTKYYPKLVSLNLDIFNIPIIVYCYKKTCDASNKLVDKLLNIGFKNIKEYEGGIVDWFNKKN